MLWFIHNRDIIVSQEKRVWRRDAMNILLHLDNMSHNLSHPSARTESPKRVRIDVFFNQIIHNIHNVGFDLKTKKTTTSIRYSSSHDITHVSLPRSS